jgi:hypothetical protein
VEAIPDRVDSFLVCSRTFIRLYTSEIMVLMTKLYGDGSTIVSHCPSFILVMGTGCV